jgi:transposase
MPAHRIDIVGQLTPKAIEKRYRSCQSLTEKEHWHVLWLMTRQGYSLSANEAALVVGRTPDAVRKVVRRYNKEGPDGLKDKRKGNSGRKPLLTRRQQKKLFTKLQKEPPDGGIWTGPKVASWVEDQTGTYVSNVTGWQYLRMLGFTLQVPRLTHSAAATPAERTVWKKNWKSQS